VNDEPDCPQPFENWHEIEKLETLEQFREALWKEIEDYRKEVRGIDVEIDYLGSSADESRKRPVKKREEYLVPHSPEIKSESLEVTEQHTTKPEAGTSAFKEELDGVGCLGILPFVGSPTPTDPLVAYARRSSIMVSSRQASTFSSPMVPNQHLPSYTDGSMQAEQGSVVSGGGVVFPSHGRTESYIVPARSRTSSTPSGEISRKLLRTLSTVSIYESIEGLPDGMAGVADIRKYIIEKQTTEADAPPSEMPRDFGIKEGDEGDEGRKQNSKFQV